jgi:hypothetical protein
MVLVIFPETLEELLDKNAAQTWKIILYIGHRPYKINDSSFWIISTINTRKQLN